MKKLLVAVIALCTVSVMADNHNHSGMITFDDFNGDANSGTFDLSFGDDDAKADKSQSIILNYTHALNSTWMVGLNYVKTDDGAGNEVDGYGVHAFYNLDHKVVDTCYVGLHYRITENQNDVETTTKAVEFGHRFGLGSWKGYHLAFSPSVNYSMTTVDNNGTESDSSGLAWNWIKFNVLF